jgi:hypothetical protein
MATFRVEVTTSSTTVYTVEARSRSQVHDQFDGYDENGRVALDRLGVPETWAIVSESDTTEQITFIRDL